MNKTLKFSQILATSLCQRAENNMTHAVKMEQFNGTPCKEGRRYSDMLWWEDRLIQ